MELWARRRQVGVSSDREKNGKIQRRLTVNVIERFFFFERFMKSLEFYRFVFSFVRRTFREITLDGDT